MKKIIALTACATLALSMVAFTACGPTEPEGGIPGKYKTASKEEVNETFESVQYDSILGNPQSADYKLGLEISSKIDADVTFPEGMFDNVNSQFQQFNGIKSTKETFELSYKLMYDKTNTENPFAGNGSLSVNGRDTYYGDSKIGLTDLSANFSHDMNWAYASADGQDGTDEIAYKVKVNIPQLIAAIGPIEGLPTAALLAEEETETVDVAEMLETLHITVGLDTSDGTKIKLTLSEDTVWEALTMISATSNGQISPATVLAAKQMVSFSKFDVNFYISLDNDGYLRETSLTFDVGATVKVGEGDGESVTASVNGFFSIKTHNDSVTIPSELATDTAYTDMTDAVIGMLPSGGIPGIGGNENNDIVRPTHIG